MKENSVFHAYKKVAVEKKYKFIHFIQITDSGYLLKKILVLQNSGNIILLWDFDEW